MWIRTQDRKRLVYCKDIEMLRLNNGDMNRYKLVSNYDKQDYFTLGTYPTEARAIEVLDEIQAHVIGRVIIPNSWNTGNLETYIKNGFILPEIAYQGPSIEYLPTIYEMPKD